MFAVALNTVMQQDGGEETGALRAMLLGMLGSLRYQRRGIGGWRVYVLSGLIDLRLYYGMAHAPLCQLIPYDRAGVVRGNCKSFDTHFTINDYIACGPLTCCSVAIKPMRCVKCGEVELLRPMRNGNGEAVQMSHTVPGPMCWCSRRLLDAAIGVL